MRQIEMFTVFLARVIFNKKDTLFDNISDENGNVTEAGELYIKIRNLVKLGKIGEAENILFDRASETMDPKYLEIALDFYYHLSHLDDEFLDENDFPKEEVAQGLLEIRKLYQVDDIVPPQ